jgi:hypothetical protein
VVLLSIDSSSWPKPAPVPCAGSSASSCSAAFSRTTLTAASAIALLLLLVPGGAEATGGASCDGAARCGTGAAKIDDVAAAGGCAELALFCSWSMAIRAADEAAVGAPLALAALEMTSVPASAVSASTFPSASDSASASGLFLPDHDSSRPNSLPGRSCLRHVLHKPFFRAAGCKA